MEPGTLVEISKDTFSSMYKIRGVDYPMIHIYPVSDESENSAVIFKDSKWKVVGAEDQPYKIKFMIPEEKVADICVNLILRKSERKEDYGILKNFAEIQGFPISSSGRGLCDEILRYVVEKENPELGIGTINIQNLARQYEHSKQMKKKETERIEKEKFIELISKTREQIIREDITKLKSKYVGQNICINLPKFKNEQLIALLDDSLIGRRVSLPLEYWQKIFQISNEPPLWEIEKIQGFYFNKKRKFPDENISNEQILDVLGEDFVQRLTGISFGVPKGAATVRIDSDTSATYAVVVKNHEEKELIYVSPSIMNELNDPSGFVRITDCIIESVSKVYLKLLRNPKEVKIPEEDIKMRLVDHFSDLGLLTIGDVITIEAEDTSLTYVIEKLVNEKEKEVYATSLPPIATDISLYLNIETQEEVLTKLRSHISEEIDPQLI